MIHPKEGREHIGMFDKMAYNGKQPKPVSFPKNISFACVDDMTKEKTRAPRYIVANPKYTTVVLYDCQPTVEP